MFYKIHHPLPIDRADLLYVEGDLKSCLTTLLKSEEEMNLDIGRTDSTLLQIWKRKLLCYLRLKDKYRAEKCLEKCKRLGFNEGKEFQNRVKQVKRLTFSHKNSYFNIGLFVKSLIVEKCVLKIYYKKAF